MTNSEFSPDTGDRYSKTCPTRSILASDLAPRPSKTILTRAQRDEFIQRGVVVIPGLASATQVSDLRTAFHQELRLDHDVDIRDLDNTGHGLAKLSSTGGAGGILDIFYSQWKLDWNANPQLFQAMGELWNVTYGEPDNDLFDHPFGPFDSKEGFMYINRVCFRLPDQLSRQLGVQQSNNQSKKSKRRQSLQRSLTPHLDCCPTAMYSSGKNIPRWRPIQW